MLNLSPYLQDLSRIDTEYTAGHINFEEKEKARADVFWKFAEAMVAARTPVGVCPAGLCNGGFGCCHRET